MVAEFFGHEGEMGTGVSEEQAESFAEGRNVFSVLVFEKAVFRAVASAYGKKFALEALAGEGRLLSFFEKELAVTFCHFCNEVLADVAETIFGKDKMVTTIDITVVFDREVAAAIRRH